MAAAAVRMGVVVVVVVGFYTSWLPARVLGWASGRVASLFAPGGTELRLLCFAWHGGNRVGPAGWLMCCVGAFFYSAQLFPVCDLLCCNRAVLNPGFPALGSASRSVICVRWYEHAAVAAAAVEVVVEGAAVGL